MKLCWIVCETTPARPRPQPLVAIQQPIRSASLQLQHRSAADLLLNGKMKYEQISNMPTVLRKEEIEQHANSKGFHESVLRSYHILRKVKWLLEKRTDSEVILELIALMESDRFKPYGQIEWEGKHPIHMGELVTSLDTIGPQYGAKDQS